MDTIGISDARTNLPKIIDDVYEKLKSFVITVSGKPKAVIMNVEELESLQETAEVLSIPGARKSIKRGFEQIKRGEYVTLDEIIKRNESSTKQKSRRKP